MELTLDESILPTLRDLLFDPGFEKVAGLAGVNHDRDIVHVFAVLPAENMHDDPENNFALRTEQFSRLHADARRQGLALVGLAHSHPPGNQPHPSPKDLGIAKRWRSMSVGAIFHSETGLVTWYTGLGVIRTDQVPLKRIHRLLLRIYAR